MRIVPVGTVEALASSTTDLTLRLLPEGRPRGGGVDEGGFWLAQPTTAGMDLIAALEALDHEQAQRLLREHPELALNRDEEGCAAVHYAAEIADARLFAQVLAADPSLVDSQDNHGFTPLFVAVTAGHTDIVKLLVQKGAQLDHVDFDKHTAVHWAVVSGQVCRQLCHVIITNYFTSVRVT